jgi:DNA ligase-1
VKAFARLLDALSVAPRRTSKLRLLEDYVRHTPDPDRGYGVAALTDGLRFRHAKPALIRQLVASRVDPVLFALSYDYVGDLAETAALIWPSAIDTGATPAAPSLSHVVDALNQASRDDVPVLLAGWLDELDAAGRFALLKLVTGGLRVGVSARLAKTALAAYGQVPLALIEEIWHRLAPPYEPLFAWLEGRAPQPADAGDVPRFRPLMLATPLEIGELDRMDPGVYRAEWKWDGIRVQIAADGSSARLYSRTGDDISGAFPDLAFPFQAVLDGELLVVRDGVVGPFNELQQRLGRKAPGRALLARHPAHVRVYDLLIDGADDLRGLPFDERRARLEAWVARTQPAGIDLSPLIPFSAWDELAVLRDGARSAGIEGLMLKRLDSTYVAGRPKGPWFKWKRDPLLVDCVLMYAQRGHGKRSSFYSDFTFGCWRSGDDNELLPVGKAYFGFTDQELVQLDRWVRANTVERFGPVRAVRPELVLEIAFDAVQPSTRHRSGIAMRFPRVHRIRWDKPAAEADKLSTLEALIP